MVTLLFLCLPLCFAAGYLVATAFAKVRSERACSAVRTELDQRLAVANNSINALEASLQERGDRIKVLEESLGAVQDAKSAAAEASATASAQATAYKEEGDRARARIDDLERELDGLQTCFHGASVQAADLNATLAARTEERDTLKASVETQAEEITGLRTDLETKQEAITALKVELKGLEESSVARLEAVQLAQTSLTATFASLSAEALKGNSDVFLQLAKAQMEGGKVEATLDLEARQVAIANLLSPVQATLAAMQEQVQTLAKDRSAAEASLGTNILSLVQAHQGLQSETAKLTTALRRPEVRGQWGEIQLRNVVEYAGMHEHVDFEIQNTLTIGDGKRRPDLLVKLPGNKRIAVDAKTPIHAYLEALDLEGAAREERLDAAAAQVRTQVDHLADKAYFNGLTESPDFVVLFLPLESLFSMALERDPHLLDDAIRRNVLPATPTTLVALLKAGYYGWAQERIQANAEEIQKLGVELLDRVMVMAEHTDALRKGLVASVEAFNKFAGSLETRVMVTGAKLKELGIHGSPSKRKVRGLHAPAAIHDVLVGLPKLGIAGEAPILDAEVAEDVVEAMESLEVLPPGDAGTEA